MTTSRSPAYEFGDFRVDGERRLLRRRDGTAVPLCPKVFETLLCLLQNRDGVLTKEALMASIWPDSIVEENNLTQNISALRRTIGETPGTHRYIVTVPGHGYRFVAAVKSMQAREITSAPVADVKTLAVLPFKPLLIEDRDAALEMGIADTLITRVGNIKEMTVRPLSSVRRFGGLEQDPVARFLPNRKDSLANVTFLR